MMIRRAASRCADTKAGRVAVEAALLVSFRVLIPASYLAVLWVG